MHAIQERYRDRIEEIIEVCVRYGELNYGASSGGNVSYRMEDNLVLITPTHTPKRKMRFEDICAVDLAGNILFAPPGKSPTGEKSMHLHILNARPDVVAVLHAHPPLLVGMSMSRAGQAGMTMPLVPEAMMMIGPVLTVPYADPNTEALGLAFDPYVADANGFLLENHGCVACSCKNALETIELVQIMESMAQSILTARIFGNGLHLLDSEAMAGLDGVMGALKIKMPGAPGRYKQLSEAFAR